MDKIPLWLQAATALLGALALADRVTRWVVRTIRTHIVGIVWDEIESPKGMRRISRITHRREP